MNTDQINGRVHSKSPDAVHTRGVGGFRSGVSPHECGKEAGSDRKLVFDFAGKACGDIALALDKEPLGSVFEISGFLAPRSQRSRQMIVHITQYSQGV